MSNPVIELTKTLIKRPSITPLDEGCQTLIAKRLLAVGFSVTDYSHEGVTNTWYSHGEGEPVFVLAGHTDVVPPGDENAWSTPSFEPQEIDTYLHGRGACDMKGSVAAMVIALERFVQAHPNHPGTIALALTSDEEGEAIHGMRHLIEQLPAWSNVAILTGEPTSSKQFGDFMKPGRRGSMHGTISVQGKQMHAGYPEENQNSIHLSASILKALSELHWPAADGFQATSIQCYSMHADAGASNVIPAETVIRWNCRYGVTPGADQIIADITQALENTGIRHHMSVSISSYPFITKTGNLSNALAKAVKIHTGLEITPSTSGGTSDSRFWAAKGYPVIDFGPLNATIHQVNEHVSIDDLITLSHIYESSIKSFLDESSKS